MSIYVKQSTATSTDRVNASNFDGRFAVIQ